MAAYTDSPWWLRTFPVRVDIWRRFKSGADMWGQVGYRCMRVVTTVAAGVPVREDGPRTEPGESVQPGHGCARIAGAYERVNVCNYVCH